ncbi:SAC3/GANP/Nin1/mts3/eIF-3 p25 [Neoconidiobolus thromboides FSU 785]|nr:SAC3/GANP/Nin1/mts3/eIF-3 p25 [Neoconidiobolus thromboides FSU 785]
MDVIDWDKDTVIGTCTNLEKNYFRLTSAPDPSKIRPVEVLKKTLKLLVKKWEENKDYTYICDQFQSVRQDLTVQRIKNNFTVYVYETFSRIALEKNDIGEFNKCQSQLKDLYEYGIEGNENEFICYRMLYFIYTRSSAEIKKMISNLTEQQEKDENIAFSLKVLRALNTSEFYTFFRLYNSATQYCKIIISFFLERERYKAMDIICMA